MPRPSTRPAFIPTTTISVLRVPAPEDPDELRDGADPEPTAEQIDSLVPASIGQARGTETRVDGERQITTTRLVCPLIDLLHTDQVIDETTSITWALEHVTTDRRLGLDYMTADLLRVTGAG